MTIVEKLLAIIAATQGVNDMPVVQMLRRLAIERLAEELAKEKP